MAKHEAYFLQTFFRLPSSAVSGKPIMCTNTTTVLTRYRDRSIHTSVYHSPRWYRCFTPHHPPSQHHEQARPATRACLIRHALAAYAPNARYIHQHSEPHGGRRRTARSNARRTARQVAASKTKRGPHIIGAQTTKTRRLHLSPRIPLAHGGVGKCVRNVDEKRFVPRCTFQMLTRKGYAGG